LAETETEFQRELGTGGLIDPLETHARRRHPSAKEYIRIFVILVVFTSIEVSIWYVRQQMGGWYLPVLFPLMIAKFSLVVLFFMHLRFDDRRFSRFFLMGLAGAVTLYFIVLLTFKTFLR
jgi:cytochrome c oxidase subunit IV